MYLLLAVETASEALNLVNGYDYKGKPIIIEFGRKHEELNKCNFDIDSLFEIVNTDQSCAEDAQHGLSKSWNVMSSNIQFCLLVTVQ